MPVHLLLISNQVKFVKYGIVFKYNTRALKAKLFCFKHSASCTFCSSI